MQVPIEIANKVSEYQVLEKKREELYKDIINWLKANSNACQTLMRVHVGDIFITDAATGEKQTSDGEYCNQQEYGNTGDSFYGIYYHKIENSEKYVAYIYEC